MPSEFKGPNLNWLSGTLVDMAALCRREPRRVPRQEPRRVFWRTFGFLVAWGLAACSRSALWGNASHPSCPLAVPRVCWKALIGSPPLETQQKSFKNKCRKNLEKKVRVFFERHACDIDDRNLKLLHFFVDNPTVLELPSSIHHQTGMWLLGCDGNIKAHSEDGQLLSDLFEIIDTMPMRKREMNTSSRNCSS